MKRTMDGNLEHVKNIFGMVIFCFVSLLGLMAVKSKLIMPNIIPLVNGKADYSDKALDGWLAAYDNLIILSLAVVLGLLLIRYIIEVIAIEHDKTNFRNIIFLIAVISINAIQLIIFFSSIGPVKNDITGIILLLGVLPFVLFYMQVLLFSPRCVKYVIFPNNLLVKK